MERTKVPGENLILKGIRNSMIRHVQSHNRDLTYQHLSQLSDIELLNNSHPSERVGYAILLFNAGIILENQLREYTHSKS